MIYNNRIRVVHEKESLINFYMNNVNVKFDPQKLNILYLIFYIPMYECYFKGLFGV